MNPYEMLRRENARFVLGGERMSAKWVEELMADKAGLRAAARAELEASGDVWPFELSGKTARASVSA